MRALWLVPLCLLALSALPARAGNGDPDCNKAKEEAGAVNGMGVNASLRDEKTAALRAAAQARAGRDHAAYDKAVASFKKASAELIERERKQDAAQLKVLAACTPTGQRRAGPGVQPH